MILLVVIITGLASGLIVFFVKKVIFHPVLAYGNVTVPEVHCYQSLPNRQPYIYDLFLTFKPKLDVTSCISWTSWIDASSCQLDPLTRNGTRHRRRCCNQNHFNNLDTCNDDQAVVDHDVVDCTPRECINIKCHCNLESELFGLRVGNCSSKTYQRSVDH